MCNVIETNDHANKIVIVNTIKFIYAAKIIQRNELEISFISCPRSNQVFLPKECLNHTLF